MAHFSTFLVFLTWRQSLLIHSTPIYLLLTLSHGTRDRPVYWQLRTWCDFRSPVYFPSPRNSSPRAFIQHLLLSPPTCHARPCPGSRRCSRKQSVFCLHSFSEGAGGNRQTVKKPGTSSYRLCWYHEGVWEDGRRHPEVGRSAC